MADPNDQPDLEPEGQLPEGIMGPADGDDVPEAPRRAASAQFVVEREVGAHAMLREAMDPANQSLREALRLSYRVLQGVILLLVVLFVFSGFHRIEEGYSGVMLRWGRILPVGDNGALDVGLHFSKWPYPAGEFVTFPDQNRFTQLDDVFVPRLRGNMTTEDAINAASINQHLTPGRDGSLLTRDGDIAHVKLSASYEIEDPVEFVRHVQNDSSNMSELDADRLVQLALERAAVQVCARSSLDEFVAFAPELQDEIERSAQDLLDDLRVGLRLTNLDAPLEPTPAFAIRKAYDDLQQTRIQVQQRVEAARREAESDLIAVAGASADTLVDLIDQYEIAVETDSGDADGLLAAIQTTMREPETTGEVAHSIAFADAYRASIDTSLGVDAKYFSSLLPAYRKNPDLVVARLWAETLSDVYSRPDVEKFYVPSDSARIALLLRGNDDVRNKRRDMQMQTRERAAMLQGIDLMNPWLRKGRDMRLSGPGRRLTQSGEGIGASRSGGGG